LSAVAANAPGRRLPPIVKITFGILVFVGIGLILKGAISPGPSKRCTTSCSQPPKSSSGGSGGQGQGLFTSKTYGFQFGYPAAGQQISVGGAGVTGYNFYESTGNFVGQMLVSAGVGREPLSYLVEHQANLLRKSNVSNLSLTGPMNGAEIGFEAGAGNMYTAEFTDSLGNVHPVQVGVVAVEHGNEWVSMIGIGTTSSSNPTPLIFSIFDGVLDEWRWTR
jgi:hypothetical protein